jgi:hypothetical protein
LKKSGRAAKARHFLLLVRPTSADTRLKDSAQSLKLILRFEKKYESQLKKTSLMKILLPSEQAETSPIAYEEIKEEKEK